MTILNKEFYVGKSPDDVWNIVGDIGNVSKWAGMIEREIYNGGDNRICIMPDGGEINEKILSHDDNKRKFEYQIINSPFPIESHHASMQVTAEGKGSKVTWITTMTPDTLATEMEPMVDQTMEDLKNYIEKMK